MVKKVERRLTEDPHLNNQRITSLLTNAYKH
jgi:hypothetical protein